jgi:hypothetical protein
MKIRSFIESGLWLCFLLILLAAASRLLPHPSNFTPVGALGLFAGAYISLRRYWLVPIMALLVSDVFIGFYNPVAMVFVYMAFIGCALLGRIMLSSGRNVIRIGFSAFLSAVLFFVISNFGVWLAGLYYPMSLTGLLQCYAMAIPFFGNTLYGDLFYVTVLFGIYEGVRTRVPHLQDTRIA